MKCFKALLALCVLAAFAIHAGDKADDKCGCSKPTKPRPTPQMPAPAAPRKHAKVAVAKDRTEKRQEEARA
jgi:hypothetical protein